MPGKARKRAQRPGASGNSMTVFWRDEQAFSLTFTAILVLPILALLALGWDLGRAWAAQHRLSHAIRAAALHGAAHLDSNAAEEAGAMLHVNFPADRMGTLGLVEHIEADPQAGLVSITVSTEIPNVLMALLGRATTPVRVAATAERSGDAPPYRLSLR